MPFSCFPKSKRGMTMSKRASIMQKAKENIVIIIISTGAVVAGISWKVYDNTIGERYRMTIEELENKIPGLNEEVKKLNRENEILKGNNLDLAEKAQSAESFLSNCRADLLKYTDKTIEESLSKNALLIKKAWDSYNTRDFKGAINWAQKCINEFKFAGRRRQEEYSKTGCDLPVGKPESEDQKNKILSDGVINDVGTAYFIVGSSYFESDSLELAKKYFFLAKAFACARTWDPKGWFWSPSLASIDKLATIQENKRSNKQPCVAMNMPCSQ
jgi:hypothetical protein